MARGHALERWQARAQRLWRPFWPFGRFARSLPLLNFWRPKNFHLHDMPDLTGKVHFESAGWGAHFQVLSSQTLHRWLSSQGPLPALAWRLHGSRGPVFILQLLPRIACAPQNECTCRSSFCFPHSSFEFPCDSIPVLILTLCLRLARANATVYVGCRDVARCLEGATALRLDLAVRRPEMDTPRVLGPFLVPQGESLFFRSHWERAARPSFVCSGPATDGRRG